jgi:methyl-accepting chemotaxis protein
MAHSIPVRKIEFLLTAAAACAALAGLFGAAAEPTGIGAFAWASFAAGAAGALAALTGIRGLRRAAAEGERNLSALEEEADRLRKLLDALRPALRFLAQEDAAVVAAVSASRDPIAFPADSPQASFADLRAFAAAFVTPNGDAFERLRRLGAADEAARALQEAEMRFPYVEEILRRVVEHTESAAMTLIERFGAIADQSEKSERDAKKAAEALGSDKDSGTGLDALIRKSHASVTGRTAVLNDFLRLNRENSDRLKKIGSLVSRSEELISGIDDITERSKLIAFNMAVESAKLGDKGLGFKVIVHELQRLNDQTTGFARDIMDIVKSFKTYNQELLDQWMKKSETLTERVRADSDEAEASVTALKKAYELTGALFSSLTESAGGVNRSMGDILASLQFQDITRQQIDGASSFILEIKGAVAELRTRYEQLGCRMGEVQSVLRTIRERHEAQLKVSKDHDIFEIMERRMR